MNEICSKRKWSNSDNKNMITVRVCESKILRADVLSEFSVLPDEENKLLIIYHRENRLGSLAAVYGISEDEFFHQVKIRENIVFEVKPE